MVCENCGGGATSFYDFISGGYGKAFLMIWQRQKLFVRKHDVPDNDWGEVQYQALANLAQMKIEGWGTEPDLQTGVKFYQLAANEGKIPEAQYIMGVNYLKGISVEVSKEKAVDYLTESAKQGFSQAQQLLKEID
jgi:TPR repeat protein